MVTAQGAGGLLGGIVALRWRPARPLVAGFMLGPVFFIPLLLLPRIRPPVPFIMLAALASLAVALELTNTWWYTVLQQRIQAEALSRVSSYDWLVSLIFQPVGFPPWSVRSGRGHRDDDHARRAAARGWAATWQPPVLLEHPAHGLADVRAHLRCPSCRGTDGWPPRSSSSS